MFEALSLDVNRGSYCAEEQCACCIFVLFPSKEGLVVKFWKVRPQVINAIRIKVKGKLGRWGKKHMQDRDLDQKNNTRTIMLQRVGGH